MAKTVNPDKPRWLILSYYANVDGRAASHHIDDRLPAFRAAGIDVTVLSSMLGAPYENAQHIRIFSLWPSAVLDELKACVKRNREQGLVLGLARLLLQIILAIPFALLSIIERKLLHRDKRWSWQFTAAARAWLWCKKNQPHLILSTGGPASAHEAALWLSQSLKLPLVCEFQDPLPFQYPPNKPFVHEHYLKLELELARKARMLVYLTDGAVLAARQRFSSQDEVAMLNTHEHRAECVAILSGAPATTLAHQSKPLTEKEKLPEKLHEKASRTLTHIGTLSDTRNLDAVLQALTALALTDKTISERFTVQLAGTLDKHVLSSIENFSLGDRIELLGRLRRRQLDDVVQAADILLLVQNAGPVATQTIPSKAFEYLQTGRPILALLGDNLQLRSILQEHGHVVYHYAEDNSELQRRLQVLLHEPLPEIKACELTVQHSVNELVRHIGT